MLFMNYAECPCCGKLIDDGAIYRIKRANLYFLVCFDCEENIPDSDIREILENKLSDIDLGEVSDNG